MAVELTTPGTKGPRLEWALWPITDKIVLSRVTALPGSPTDGDIYIVPHGAGAHPDEIALRFEGAWIYLTPLEGWTAYVLDSNENVQFDGAVWNAVTTSGIPSSYLDTDGTLAANSDAKVATQKAVKTYADGLIAASDAMVFKGVIDCSANPNYPAADRGHQYRASVAGKIGGASGINVEVGDMMLCLTDGTASGNQATVGSAWSVIQTNLDGAVINTRQVISGGGLTGGGDLSADRTLAVGAGTGIVVNADDVAVDKASAGNVQAGTNNKVVTSDGLISASAPQTLTDGANISWNMHSGFNAEVTIAGNRTLDAPTNYHAGLSYALTVIQDGTGSRLMTWPSSFDWGSIGAPTLSTGAGKKDLVFLFCYDASTPKFRAMFSKAA
ncbi:MAG: DUF2793 domain-containing protein [Mesorhizobium sp.]|uniref:DUF2793 domain-containing protein n=1 Tax=Mesorhizobium sp. TaxID=1871066 RepID=UPI000FE99924|nr:DUF2793 domain-containing protein [Mesorhizobium sp.]RWE77331.1 MAG: DUF2793 domain-containing protein [Mesorhizobium sp.]TJW59087.1 MAG: DUF2793 domain-containing protein [Mesorhizobium sp.]